MSDPDLFERYLRTGERILWRVSGSDDLAETWYRKIRRETLLMAGGCTALGLYVGYNQFQAIARRSASADSLTLLVDVARYGFAIASFAMAALSVWGYFRLAYERSQGRCRASIYATTNMRFLEVDSLGELTDEIDLTDIAELHISDGRFTRGDLIARGSGPAKRRKLFSFSHVEDAASIRAKLQDLFPDLPR